MSCFHVGPPLPHILSAICFTVQCAGLSPGTTKNLHLEYLSLNHTVHTPDCSILECLSVLKMSELFFVVPKTAKVDLGNKILKVLNGIRLPLLLVSILYVICSFLTSAKLWLSEPCPAGLDVQTFHHLMTSGLATVSASSCRLP